MGRVLPTWVSLCPSLGTPASGVTAVLGQLEGQAGRKLTLDLGAGTCPPAPIRKKVAKEAALVMGAGQAAPCGGAETGAPKDGAQGTFLLIP